MYQSAKNLIVGVISAAITLGASLTHAGHHEQLQPPAKPGQVVVVYQGACPATSSRRGDRSGEEGDCLRTRE